jgi:hypothetical protein
MMAGYGETIRTTPAISWIGGVVPKRDYSGYCTADAVERMIEHSGESGQITQEGEKLLTV